MTVRLYITSLSNPSYAAVGMLAHKRLAHRRIDLLTGFHPYLVRAAGFRKIAMEIDRWGIFTVSLAERVAA